MSDKTGSAVRHVVGDFIVSALADGMLHESAGVLQGIDAAGAAALLTAASQPGEPVISVSAFLIRTGAGLVLIDAGCGDGMGAGAGFLVDSLQQDGVAPGDIGLILLTHLHPDHIGGLLGADGSPRFPRARILAPAADAAVFLDPAIAETVPEEAKPVFAKARAVALAYAGRFATFEGTEELAPGIAPVPLPGHSPGHVGYRIASGDASLLIWGDVVHVPYIQFQRPDVGMVFDADPERARETRLATFAASARSREPIAGMHMPFPAFARVTQVGGVFGFEPLSSTSGIPASQAGDEA